MDVNFILNAKIYFISFHLHPKFLYYCCKACNNTEKLAQK